MPDLNPIDNMLLLLLLQLYISLAAFVAGTLYYCFLFKRPAAAVHPVLVLLSGSMVQLVFAQIWSLFFPLHIYTSIGLNIAMLLLLLLGRKKTFPFIITIRQFTKSISGWQQACFFIIAAGLLMITAGPTMMDDTESYHLQIVRWLHEWGTVPGLANLHLRYGFHSSWLNGVALYSFGSSYNYYTALNGALSLWVVFYLLAPAHVPGNLAKPFKAACHCTLLLLLLLWCLLRKNSSTANYDFITAACTLVLVAETLKQAFYEAMITKKAAPPEWVVYPIFLCSVRIINFPLLLLTACFIFWERKSFTRRHYLSVFCTALLILAPFAVRNYMLSGYPFFPSMVFAAGKPNWRADPVLVKDILYYIKYFNRVNNAFLDIEQTAALPFPAWTGKWFHYLFGYDKLLVTGGATGMAIFLTTRWIKKHRLLRWMIAALTLQTILWFFLAPDPRFIYGIFVSGFLLGFFTLLSYITSNYMRFLQGMLPVIAALFVLCITVRNWYNHKQYRNPIQPVAMPRPQAEVIYLSNQRLVIPKAVLGNWNPRCFDLKPPCLYQIDNRLGLRGSSLQDGFYLQQPEKR